MLLLSIALAQAAEPAGLCLIQATVEGEQVRLQPLLCEPSRVPEQLQGLRLGPGVHVVELEPWFAPEVKLRVRPDLSVDSVRSDELWPIYVPGNVLVGLEHPDSATELPGIELQHWTQVRAKKPPAPHMPAEAKRTGAEGDCKVRVALDETGRPTACRFEPCPVVFQDSVAEAHWESTYYPFKQDGQAVPAHFVYVFKYKLSSGRKKRR